MQHIIPVLMIAVHTVFIVEEKQTHLYTFWMG